MTYRVMGGVDREAVADLLDSAAAIFDVLDLAHGAWARTYEGRGVAETHPEAVEVCLVGALRVARLRLGAHWTIYQEATQAMKFVTCGTGAIAAASLARWSDSRERAEVQLSLRYAAAMVRP